jgi:diguanylate cyclase (GGDEF)-like protein
VTASAPENRRAHTILIVDDDPDLRTLVSKQLEQNGFAVIGAPDAQSALDTLDVIVPDVVVADVMMPSMDGYEFTRQVRELPSAAHVPIIILTSRHDADDLVRGLDAGADDYLVKPFGASELLARIRAKIRRVEGEARLQPLTRLPGNIAIDHELDKRLRTAVPWAVLYADIDNFKAFNDTYGFVHGDKAIVLFARILQDAMRRKGGAGDFVGHIGGDDFVIVTTPRCTERIAEEIIVNFDREVRSLYNPEHLKRGGVTTKDRQGNVHNFPIMTVSIAIVTSERSFKTVAQIGEIAAELKEYAKSKLGSVYVKDKRR